MALKWPHTDPPTLTHATCGCLPTDTSAMFSYPPLFDRSALLPDRPELMDNSVGECLSAILQEDTLMGSERPYGSRLSAAEDDKQTSCQIWSVLNSFCSLFVYFMVHSFVHASFTFDASQFLLPLVRRLVGRSASSQCLRDKFVEERQRGVHLENKQSSAGRACKRHI